MDLVGVKGIKRRDSVVGPNPQAGSCVHSVPLVGHIMRQLSPSWNTEHHQDSRRRQVYAMRPRKESPLVPRLKTSDKSEIDLSFVVSDSA